MTETKPEGLAPSESWPGLLDFVLALSTSKDSKIHGQHHWAGVAAAGLCLLDTTPGADPFVVLLFSLLHDSMRRSDGPDPEHGASAARLARNLREAGVFELDAGRMETLEHALEYHDKGEVSKDSTVGACWDADRLNLWRVGRGPASALLSTTAGRLAARLGLGGWPTMVSSVALGWQPIFLGYAAKIGGASGVYLRFGDLPRGGRSRVVGWMNFREAGVSVYPGHRREDGAYVLDFRGLMFGLDTRYLSSLLWGGRPLYVVEGQQVGVGNMGEPVLCSARIVGEVGPEEARVLPDRDRFREVLELWRARLRGDVVEATALLLSGNPGPEERSFVPPMAAFSWPFSGSVDEVVRGHLERWGMAEDWDRMRAEGERKQAEKRRQRLLLEEMERQADPFGTGPEKYAAGRTFSTSRDRTRRGWQPEPERGQW